MHSEYQTTADDAHRAVAVRTRVVRKLGSDATHVADVLDTAIAGGWFYTSYVGAETPLDARCGRTLWDGQGRPAPLMRAGSKVTCRKCRKLTGIDVAAQDNETLPASAVQR